MTNPKDEVPWTPGPWEVDKDNCHAGQVATCHGDLEGYAEVWSRQWSNGVDQYANARLIAESPTMAALLEEWASPDDCGCDTAMCQGVCLPAKTRDALARIGRGK